jgi:hypothetical protein
MAKIKKNQHIIYQRKWHPKSYSKQARNSVKSRLETWETLRYTFYKDSGFSEVLANACHSYRCNIVKHRIIKGLRRYGKRKGLI